MSIRRPSVGRIAAVGTVLLLAGVRGRAETPALKLPERIGFKPVMGTSLPMDASVRDHLGEAHTLSDFFDGRPVIVMPVYYRCPMLCGLELNGLVRCLRGMTSSAGAEFQIVTFSIDPQETPALADQKRKTYLAEYGRDGADRGWHFLTGQAAEIQRLCEALGFRTEYDERSRQYAHAAGLVICTPDGRIARQLSGVEFAPRDVEAGLKAAARGKTESSADSIQLFCYMYDPTTGKYGAAVLLLLRVAGVITVIALATGVTRMLRHGSRAAQEEPMPHG